MAVVMDGWTTSSCGPAKSIQKTGILRIKCILLLATVLAEYL